MFFQKIKYILKQIICEHDNSVTDIPTTTMITPRATTRPAVKRIRIKLCQNCGKVTIDKTKKYGTT